MATIQEALQIALGHHQAGRLQQAEQLYQKILRVSPQQPDALHLLGLVWQAQGNHESAVASIQRALQIKPDFAEAHSNLGNVFKDQIKWDAAVASYRRALQINPDYAEAHNNLGNVFRDLGKLDKSVASYQRALQIKPDFAEAHNNLGVALQDEGRLSEAVASIQRALQINPDYAEAHNNLGVALQDEGRLSEAVASIQRALQIKPDYAEAHYNLGVVLRKQGRIDDAIASYKDALQTNPRYVDAHTNLGNSLKDQGRLDEAVACYQRALDINPDYVEALINLGVARKGQGRLDEAIASNQRALQIKPDFAEAHSNLLMLHQYRPGIPLDQLATLHAEWNRMHAASLHGSIPSAPSSEGPGRRLRLGFVSPDFGRHPVGYFLIRCLEALDPAECETFCYSDRLKKDSMTNRISAAAGEWRDCFGKSDEALASIIREDRIDVLFDLAGHTSNNRLLVFARKPAPIQASWIGYVGTTGLEAMDYVVADRFHVPPEAEPHYCERILRLPDGYVCYDPPVEAPDVAELPAFRQGHVTFGCFNNVAKLNDDVVELWSEILRRIPHSRLVLRYRGLDDDGLAIRFRESFARHGIDAGRLELHGKLPHAELLDTYNQIDIALDPFPYSGGLTTCESLWMGVPVITCPGATFAGRHSLSHLSVVGLTEMVAQDNSHYVELAAQLADDLPRLRSIRADLRQRMARSPLCDAERFASNFIRSVRQVWQEHVRGSQPASDD